MPTKAEIQANAATLIDEFQTPRMQASMKATQAGQATAVQNDPDKEQAAISKLGLTQTQANMLAKNPIHRKSLLEVAYGDSVGQLQEYQDLLAGEANFRETEEAFQGGAPSGTKMKVLEDALRNKNDVGIQTLGQSELFKSAGVGGYGALSQSLAQRGLEMQDRYGSFVNQLDRVGGFLSDTHNVVASQYKTLIEESRRAEDQYNAVQGSIAKHEQAMDIMERRYKLQAEAKALAGGSSKYTSFNAEALPSKNGEFNNKITGSGTITAYGSDAWKHGLDVAGTAGSAVSVPMTGEIVSVESGFGTVGPNNIEGKKQNGGFGNQVGIKTEDGNIIWLSHLESTNPDLFVGMKVGPGDSVGTLGNTGYTEGQTGNHVDITMSKDDGNYSPTGRDSYLSPEEVEAYISGDWGFLDVDTHVPTRAQEDRFESKGDIPYGEKEVAKAKELVEKKKEIIKEILNDEEDLQEIKDKINDLTDIEAIAFIQKSVKGEDDVDLEDWEAENILEAANSL